MKLRLSCKGDRIWKWLKERCPGKRKAGSAPPTFPGFVHADCSLALPLKKRMCVGFCDVLAPLAVPLGDVALPDGPPAEP